MRKSGMSYRAIAATLSHAKKIKLTKNMIVGAVHRHGLAVKLAGGPAKAKPKLETPRVLKPAPAVARRTGRVTTEIKGKTCLYIEGEPKDRNFCGAQVVTDAGIPHAAPVWCEKHLSIVYLPKSRKKEKVATRIGRYVVWQNKY